MYRLVSGGAVLAKAKTKAEIDEIKSGYPASMTIFMKTEVEYRINCMMCGCEGGKDYHNPEWLNNREKLLIVHIVRCDKCYDHVAQEIWSERCNCFENRGAKLKQNEALQQERIILYSSKEAIKEMQKRIANLESVKTRWNKHYSNILSKLFDAESLLLEQLTRIEKEMNENRYD